MTIDTNTVYTHPSTKQCSYTYNHPTTKQCSYSVPIVNNLTSTSTTSALSAYQGKALNEKINAVSAPPGSSITSVTETLTSGRNPIDIDYTKNFTVSAQYIIVSARNTNYPNKLEDEIKISRNAQNILVYQFGSGLDDHQGAIYIGLNSSGSAATISGYVNRLGVIDVMFFIYY